MEIAVLGPLAVSSARGQLRIDGIKTRALLVCLLLYRGEVVPADRLVDDLWDGDPPARAEATLYAYISKLRKALVDDGVVQTRKPGYQLLLAPEAVDACRFEVLVRQARLAVRAGEHTRASTLWGQALALWRGPALQGFADAGFARAEAIRLDELRLEALEARIESDLRLGRHVEVVSELKRLVARHGLREQLCAQLMLALYRCGRQAEALQVHRDARGRLLRELGVQPGPHLQKLHTAVLLHDPALRWPVTDEGQRPVSLASVQASRIKARPLPPRCVGPPLVGRAQPLAQLRAAWSGPAPRPRIVIVTGEPGMGKTRLAEAFSLGVQEEGATVLWGRALSESTTPYEPVLDALHDCVSRLPPRARPALAGPGAALLGRLIPDLPAPTSAGASGPAPFQRFLFFEAVADLLHDAAAGGRALLVVDDLQWADRSTVLLLSHLARYPGGRDLLVLAMHREAEWHPGRTARDLLTPVERDGLLQHLPLDGLDLSAAQELLTTVSGTPAANSVGRALHVGSRGNPFFLEQAAQHLAGTGSDGESWASIGPDELPRRLRDLVRQRLQRLAQPSQRALAAAAVAGTEFTTATLAAALQESSATTELLLAPAVSDGVLRRDPVEPEHYGFSHALVRDVLYASVTPTQRSGWHRRIGMYLRRSEMGELPLEQLVHHLCRSAAADAELAVTYATLAGERAFAALGFSEAAAHYETALEMLPLLPDGKSLRGCRLLLALGDARLAEYEPTATVETYRSAMQLALRLRAVEEMRRAVAGLVAGIEFGTVDEAAAGLLEQGLARTEFASDLALRARMLAALARVLPAHDPRVSALARDAETVASIAGDAETSAVVTATLLLVTWGTTGPVRRRALATSILALSGSDRWPELALEVCNMRAAAAEELGDFLAVDQDLAVLEVGAIKSRRPFLLGLSRMRAAGRALGRGDYAEAEAQSARALEYGQHSPNFFAAHLAQTFVARRDQGRVAEVHQSVAAIVHDTGSPTWRAVLAIVHLEMGNRCQSALEMETLHAAGFAQLPRDWLWMPTLAYLAEVSAALGHQASARDLYELLLPFAEHNVVVAHGILSTGAMARNLALLATALGNAEVAEEHYLRALELNERWGLEPWQVRTQLAYGQAIDRTEPGSSVAAQLRASSLRRAQRLGMLGVLSGSGAACD